jgi:ribonuclease R
MSLKFTSRLLDHLQHERYEPSTVRRLAEDLGIHADEFPAFRGAVLALAREGTLVLDDRKGSLGPDDAVVVLPPMGSEITGTFRKNQRGFGFVVPDRPYREGDLFIPREETLDALTGDTVRVAVERGFRRGERDTTGRILEVIKRKRKSFTGELTRRGGQWLVFPDGKELTQPVVVPDATSKNANIGDKVVVELLRYPEGDMIGEGVVVRVLGEAGKPDVETQAVIAAYDLPPDEFPEACMEQARRAAARFEEETTGLGGRRSAPSSPSGATGSDDPRRGPVGGAAGADRIDLTDEFIITIDPPDAKDYDDAISIRRTTVDGAVGWELGVHIADVAHFIPAGSPLDEEARRRGNSCYLPRHVIPMLPEILSNGICSLQEGVVRYCKSAFMTYDREGRIRREGVGATVIRSAKRLTYLEAQALIDGDVEEAKKHAKTEPRYTDELIATLREMDTCSRMIRERRRKAGMIHLELPEVNLVYDEHGHVVDAEPEDSAYTHTLIEMFMVEANEVLARLFEGLDVPLIRRIHPEPTPGDVEELQMYARVAGYRIPKRPTREELQSLLDATAGTGAARAVHMAVLRTLTKAEYSPARIGHYALASSAYAHFTSPIRRYADLTVHRALAEYLSWTDNGRNRPRDEKDRRRLGRMMMDRPRIEGSVPDEDELVEIARHITATEQNAEAAENNLRQFLVLQLLSDHIGEAFDGIVTGVSPSGVFVQLEKYLADGFIKAADLPTGGKEGHARFGGRWQVDPRTGALVSQSGRSFNIGDRLTVAIAAIDLALRKMDLAVADPGARAAGKSKKPVEALGGGLGGGGLRVDWETLKYGRTGSQRRAQRSKARERSKQDFRKERRERGKR